MKAGFRPRGALLTLLVLAGAIAALWVSTRPPRFGPLRATPTEGRLSVEVGEAVHFAAAAPGAVEFTWSIWGSAVSHLPTWTYVALPEDAGWQQVTLVVRGTTGSTLARAWDLGVVPPVPPAIDVSPPPGHLVLPAGSRASFHCGARVPAARPSDHLWFEWTVDGRTMSRQEQPATDAVSEFLLRAPEPGSHRIMVRVIENERTSSLAEWVLESSRPSVATPEPPAEQPAPPVQVVEARPPPLPEPPPATPSEAPPAPPEQPAPPVQVVEVRPEPPSEAPPAPPPQIEAPPAPPPQIEAPPAQPPAPPAQVVEARPAPPSEAPPGPPAQVEARPAPPPEAPSARGDTRPVPSSEAPPAPPEQPPAPPVQVVEERPAPPSEAPPTPPAPPPAEIVEARRAQPSELPPAPPARILEARPAPPPEAPPPAALPRAVRSPVPSRVTGEVGERLHFATGVASGASDASYDWSVDGRRVQRGPSASFEYVPDVPGRHRVAVALRAGGATTDGDAWQVTTRERRPAASASARKEPAPLAEPPRVASLPATTVPPVPHATVPRTEDRPAAPGEMARLARPGAALSEEEVHRWLDDYAHAWSRHDVGALQRMGQVRSQADAERLLRYFGTVEDLRVDVRVRAVRVDGERAAVEFERVDTMTDPSGRRQELRLPLQHKEIQRTPDGLRFVN